MKTKKKHGHTLSYRQLLLARTRRRDVAVTRAILKRRRKNAKRIADALRGGFRSGRTTR